MITPSRIEVRVYTEEINGLKVTRCLVLFDSGPWTDKVSPTDTRERYDANI